MTYPSCAPPPCFSERSHSSRCLETSTDQIGAVPGSGEDLRPIARIDCSAPSPGPRTRLGCLGSTEAHESSSSSAAAAAAGAQTAVAVTSPVTSLLRWRQIHVLISSPRHNLVEQMVRVLREKVKDIEEHRQQLLRHVLLFLRHVRAQILLHTSPCLPRGIGRPPSLSPTRFSSWLFGAQGPYRELP